MWIEPIVFLQAGYQLLRRHTVHAHVHDEGRWRWTFNASPTLCSTLWHRIEPERNIPDAPRPIHLLWALMFMNLYCTETVNTTLTESDATTFRKYTWRFVEAIAYMAPEIIDFDRRFDNRNGNVCVMSIDGVDFSILEPMPFWEGYFSHKFQGPGLRYEIGVCIATGWIVWINGPFPAGRPDLTIFRDDLMHELEDDEKVLADKGYNGEPDFIVTATHLENLNFNELLRRYYIVRARHETVNRRLKVWNILGHRFRHGVTKHGAAFRAVAVIEQLKIQSCSPMFDVEWEDYGLDV